MQLKIWSMICSTKQLHLLILCTFSRFGESGFGESGGHLYINTSDEPNSVTEASLSPVQSCGTAEHRQPDTELVTFRRLLNVVVRLI